jgi:hypothetical protein
MSYLAIIAVVVFYTIIGTIGFFHVMTEAGPRTLAHEKFIIFIACVFWPLTIVWALLNIFRAEFEIWIRGRKP